ncbi:MAG: FecR domain-containing protein [Chitinophagaceae bacterium]
MALIKRESSDSIAETLLAKYLSREATMNETAVVEAWIKESDANKKYVEQLELIWSESKKLRFNNKPDVQKALNHFQERTKATSTTPIYKMRWWRIAAIVLLIAGVATIVKLSNYPHSKQPDVLKFVAGNIIQTDTLPDGSVIQLQPNAELSCPAKFTTSQRSVTLKGDAYFSVLHDTSRPFQISVNNLKVLVLGTSFKISNLIGSTEVDVITGVVQVIKKERSMKVYPHEKLIVPASGDFWIKQSDTLLPGQLPKQNQVPQKNTKKLLAIEPAAQPVDSIVNDYSHQRQTMISILNDLISEGVVSDRKSIVWTALTNSVLIVNGETQPEALHQKLKTKYKIDAEEGYYYGSVQITGKGYFFDSKDLK